MKVTATGIVESRRLLTNIRVWATGEFPKELVDRTSTQIVKKSKRNANSRTRKRTGELLAAHDRALVNRAVSSKGLSATIIIDAINKRGDSYAGAVEAGAQNPMTGGRNRPRWFFGDAVEEVVSQELDGITFTGLSKIPKK